ncbi:MAG: flavoprotein [Clostridiales bacterium]|jgi:flavodoxin|nr:flavoprotein [Clostridiales bacterium]
MKIAVVYQSRGGNTKAVAEAIARAAGVAAEPIGKAFDGTADLLFIGGGVYAWGLDKDFKAYLETLSAQNVKAIVPFTTAGGMDKTKDIAAIAEKNGIAAANERLAVRFGLKNHGIFGGGKSPVTLADKQVAAVNEFVSKALAEAEAR